MPSILLLGVIAYSRAKRSGFDMLDSYLLMVLMYFGIYSIIGIVATGASEKNVLAVMLTYILIMTALFVLCALYGLLSRRVREKLIFANLIAQWANVDRRAVVLLAMVYMAFSGYIFMEYGMITYVGAELENLNISVPTWVGPVKVIMRSIGFCCFVYFVSSIVLKRTKVFSFVGPILLALIFLLSLDGRRAMVELMLVAFILWSSVRRRNIYSFKSFPFVLIMIVAYIFLSNVFQTYRTEVLTVSYNINGGEVTSLSDAALNIDATIENHHERSAMWNFNYMITDEQIKHPMTIGWGSLVAQSVRNSIPRLLWNNKVVIDGDEMVALLYGFPVTDYPTNDFASLLADFGPFMVVIFPSAMISILYLCSYYSRFNMKNSMATLIIPVLCLQYLIKIENSYNDFILLLLNCLYFCMLSFGAVLLQPAYKAISGVRLVPFHTLKR